MKAPISLNHKPQTVNPKAPIRKFNVDGVLRPLEALAGIACKQHQGVLPPGESPACNKGALIITNTLLWVPYYNFSTMGPKTLFQLSGPL